MSKKHITVNQAVARGLLPKSFLRSPAGVNYPRSTFNSAGGWAEVAKAALSANQALGRLTGRREITAVNDAFGLGERRAVSRGTVAPSGETKSTIVTAPLAQGVSMPMSSSSQFKIGVASQPNVPGIQGGIRLMARFMGPNTAIQNAAGESAVFSPAAGFNSGNGPLNVPGLFLNPGDDRYTWTFDNVGTSGTQTGSVALQGIFATVPKLAALARCFERFLFREVTVETVGELQPAAVININGASPPATKQVNGVVRFGYASDPFSLCERDWEDEGAGSDQEADFAWVANMQQGFTVPFWQSEARACLYRHQGRPDTEDYRYVHMNVDDSAVAQTMVANQGPIQTVMRSMMQGAIVCAHDLGQVSISGSPPVPVIVRRNFFTVVVDLHNVILGAPVSTTLRLKEFARPSTRRSLLIQQESARAKKLESKTPGPSPVSAQQDEDEKDIELLPVPLTRQTRLTGAAAIAYASKIPTGVLVLKTTEPTTPDQRQGSKPSSLK